MNTTPVMKQEIVGEGNPLVLVPGGLTGWLSWIPHAQALSATRKVIRLQLFVVEAGLEGIPLPPNYSIDYEVEALGNALDNLGLEQVDLAAWSYGAATSLSYAIRNPHRIKSLTLIEPPAMWVLRTRGPLSSQLLEEQKYIQTLATDDVSEEQLVWFSHFAGFVPPNVDPRSLPTWPSWFKHRQSLRNGDAVYRHNDDINLVRAFSKPVLLFKGEGSAPFLHQIIDILAEEFPNAHVETLPGGHALHILSMPAFMDIFSHFLQETKKATVE